MRPLPVPTVPLNDRYIVTRVTEISSCYAVTLRHGYTDHVLHPDLARDVILEIERAIASVSYSHTRHSLQDLFL